MKPHKHADLIKAWADGAQIECKNSQTENEWLRVINPNWDERYEYRVWQKNMEIADVIEYFRAIRQKTTGAISFGCTSEGVGNHTNLKIVFDGETGQPKSVELVK